MKRILICALTALFTLSGCTPMPEAAPSPQPGATAALTLREAPLPSPAPAEEAEALEPMMLDELMYRGQSTPQEPLQIPFDPQILLDAWGCSVGNPARLTAGEIAKTLEGTPLPEPFFYDTEPTFDYEISYYELDALPIGGVEYEAKLIYCNQLTFSLGGPLYLFLRADGEWVLYDDIYVPNGGDAPDSHPLYQSDLLFSGNGTHAFPVNQNCALLYSEHTGNTWLVGRWLAHGSGYDCWYEDWHNLHACAHDFTVILEMHDLVPGDAEYIYGLVDPGRLGYVEIAEELAELKGPDLHEVTAPDRFGTWIRRYVYNEETHRLEPELERWCEGASAAFAMEHILLHSS